jgi:hypothetical protein
MLGSTRELYLDLLIKVLANTIYEDPSMRPFGRYRSELRAVGEDWPLFAHTIVGVKRLDGDLYQSTHEALTALYPKLSPGGFVIVDDFGLLPPCRKAVSGYRASMGITSPAMRHLLSSKYSPVFSRESVAGLGCTYRDNLS